MNKKEYQISLDSKLAQELRDTINGEINISLNKRQTLSINRKEKEYPAWSLICAIMDRIDDTVDYLNSLKLNTGKYHRSAFDFFAFINQAVVIIDCIDMLAKIYDVSFSQEDLSTNIFSQKGKDGQGTDKKYFAYIRSLCSVHPVETSYYSRTYQDNDFESSPFVVWNDGHIWLEDDCDISAVVYINKAEDYHKRVHIKISEVFSYVAYRYNLLNKVIESIKQYNKSIIQSYIERPIKKPEEFIDYIQYLENLKQEAAERFGDEYPYVLEFMISIMKLEISNSQNQDRYQKYCNALKYAVKFEHHALQQMNFEGFCNNGIIHPKINVETTLLHELYQVHSGGREASKYGYNIQKISYLNYDSGYYNKCWAFQMIEEAKCLFEKYIIFEGAQSDFEYYALVQIALYFDCLENKCLVNKNIPNSLDFRVTLLSEEELVELLKPESLNSSGEKLFDFIKDLDEIYL